MSPAAASALIARAEELFLIIEQASIDLADLPAHELHLRLEERQEAIVALQRLDLHHITSTERALLRSRIEQLLEQDKKRVHEATVSRAKIARDLQQLGRAGRAVSTYARASEAPPALRKSGETEPAISA